MKRRLLSVLLVLCMVIPIVPMGTKEVWAESTIISLDVPLYAQSKNYTCADASSRMCIGYYFGLGYNTGKSSTIPSEDALVSNYGYGSHTPIVKGISEYCGISYKYISKQSTVSAFEDYIYSQLIDGKPVVLNVYSKKNEYLGYPTPNGHYIVVTGMQKSNSETILYINDPFSPSSYSGQGYKPQKITPKISDVYKTVQYMDGEQDGKIIQDKRCKHDSDYKKKGLCGDCGAWNTSFTKASVNTGYYTTNTDTNLKSQPYAVCDNTNGKSTAVPKGKTVKVVEAYYNALGNNDDHLWYKVVYNGESGYIFSKRLTYKSAAPNNAEKYHLDVNGLLDGSNAGNVSGYGKFDIYINGKLSTNKTDYYEELYYGTTYEITNIRAEDGCVYNGVTEGKIKGTVTDSDIVIRLSFEERILPKVYFDAQGGAFGTVLTSKLDGINTGRKEGQLILYNEAGTQHDTTVYGNEIAVGADGRITDIRRYGVKTLLTVPSGGFVLSGHSAWDSNAGQSYGGGVFVSSILELSDPYVRANRKTNEAIAYDGYDAYLADGKYYQETASCLELPVPKRDGYYFAGWYNSNGQRMYYNSVLSDTELTARWTTDPQPVASTTYNGHSYDVFDYNMSWLEAKAFCESRGGHLVSITSDGEQQAVLNAILLGNLNLYYIGASDAETEGSWKWVDGETFDYDNWDKGAPEPNGKTKENYACIINTSYGPYKTAGEWIDCPNVTNGGFYTCSNTGFICEYDSYEPVPQTELFGLHVTAYVDGIITEDLQGVGSFDVYLNGELSVDDISYFSSQFTYQDTYLITDIQTYGNVVYNGVVEGSLSGKAGKPFAEVCLSFSTISTVDSYGQCGDNLFWTLEDGLLTVTGNGPMWESEYDSSLWNGFDLDIKELRLCEGVSTIGAYAFVTCENLHTVHIPDSMQYIGFMAFQYATGIKTVKVPGLESYLKITFDNCPMFTGASLYIGNQIIEHLRIPDGITEVPALAFEGCLSIKSVEFPEGMTTIGRNSFKNCKNIVSVSIPVSLGLVESEAFYGCDSLSNVYYSGSDSKWNSIEIQDWNDPLINASRMAPAGSAVSNGVYYIKNVQLEKYLQVSYDKDENKQNIDVYDLGIDVLGMQIEVTNESNGYKLRPLRSASRVVNVFADTVVSGKNVCLYDNTSDASQRWAFENIGGKFVIRNAQNNNVALDVDSSWNALVSTYGNKDSQHWILQNCIQYDANGGTDAPEYQLKNYGESVRLSDSVPSRDGYVFYGWNTKADGTGENYVSGALYSDNRNTTLYAVWYSFAVTWLPSKSEPGTIVGVSEGSAPQIIVTLPKLSNKYYACEVVKEATCTAEGIERYTWNETAYGSFSFKTATEKGYHNYDSVVTAPTCTEQGYTTFTCSVCGDSYVANYEQASGHQYQDYSITTKPTASAAGKLTGTCANCSATITVDMPKLNTTDYTVSTRKEATCTEKGTQRYTWNDNTYGTFYVDKSIAAKGHNWGAPVYSWTDDCCMVTGIRVCSNDASHKETETVNTSSSQSGNVITYIAEFDNPAFSTQKKTKTIEVSTSVLGDVNYDGEVDANDLTALSRHVARIEEFTGEALLKAADVNKDGEVDANDLTVLSRFVAKIINSFD